MLIRGILTKQDTLSGYSLPLLGYQVCILLGVFVKAVLEACGVLVEIFEDGILNAVVILAVLVLAAHYLGCLGFATV
jgi:hypothetical protein